MMLLVIMMLIENCQTTKKITKLKRTMMILVIIMKTFQTTEEITKLMPEDFNKKLKEWEQIKEGKPSPR